MKKLALGIDPGLKGAFVLFDGKIIKAAANMPLLVEGKEKEVEFDGIHALLWELQDQFGHFHVFLERAVSFGMGTKGAFNYGRGFAAVEIALELFKFEITYVEASKWTKEMHAGISGDLKPKAKSLIALKRLFPKLVDSLPRDTKGRVLDGHIDALLIAAYGHQRIPKEDEGTQFDFE